MRGGCTCVAAVLGVDLGVVGGDGSGVRRGLDPRNSPNWLPGRPQSCKQKSSEAAPEIAPRSFLGVVVCRRDSDVLQRPAEIAAAGRV